MEKVTTRERTRHHRDRRGTRLRAGAVARYREDVEVVVVDVAGPPRRALAARATHHLRLVEPRRAHLEEHDRRSECLRLLRDMSMREICSCGVEGVAAARDIVPRAFARVRRPRAGVDSRASHA